MIAIGNSSITRAEKLGKDDAEKDYRQKLLLAVQVRLSSDTINNHSTHNITLVQSRPDLFASSDIKLHYSMEMYHIMGSRILSRSFDVEQWDQEEEEDSKGNTSIGSSMDVDLPSADVEEPPEEHEHGDNPDGDHDEEESSNIAMVPMADILNARYGSENVSVVAPFFFLLRNFPVRPSFSTSNTN